MNDYASSVPTPGQLIEVNFEKDSHKVFEGAFIKATAGLYVMLQFDSDRGRFDGIAVFRNKDVIQWRTLLKREEKRIKLDNRQEVMGQYDFASMKTFYSVLQQLSSRELVGVYTDPQWVSFYVGKVLRLDRSSVLLRLVNTKGTWSNSKKLALTDIHHMVLGDSYEKGLMRKLRRFDD